ALHASSGFRINELPSRAVVGKVGDVVKIDEDQVRLVAGPDGAETTGETGRSRVADRGMAQNLVRKARTRLRLADGSGEAKHLRCLEHALHVATAAVVAAQPETHARLSHVVNRSDAALELEVAELVKHDAGIGGRHAIDLLAGDPDAVDNVEPGSEQTYVVHVADQRAVMVREQLTRNEGLPACLVDVGVDGKIIFVGKFGAPLQHFRRAALRRERRNGPMQSPTGRVALELMLEVLKLVANRARLVA